MRKTFLKGGTRMNLNDMAKNLDKKKLDRALNSFGGVMTREELNAVKNALGSPDLGKKLSGISAADINGALNGNDGLKKALNGNPELMKNLNAFLKNK